MATDGQIGEERDDNDALGLEAHEDEYFASHLSMGHIFDGRGLFHRFPPLKHLLQGQNLRPGCS